MRSVSVVLCAYLVVGCSNGPDGNGFIDEDIPALIRAFLTGSAQTEIDLPADGCLETDVVVDTGVGIRLELDAGTCIRQRTGELIRGPLVVAVDDGGVDVDWLAGQVAAALGGSVRVWAGLPDPGGGDPTMVDVSFDPPARLVFDGVLGEFSGRWVFENFSPAIAANQLAGATPPGEPPSGIRWERFNFTRMGPEGDVLIPVSTLTGAYLDDDTLPPAGFECAGDVVFSSVLGPVGSEYPRVCCVRLVNPRTAEIRAASCWYPGLFFPGQSRVIGPNRDIEVRIVERDGQRVFEICSPYKNQFVVLWSCCTGPEIEDRERKQNLTDASGEEEDLDGPYDGAIEIDLRGWGGIRAFFAARTTITNARPDPLKTTVDRSIGFGGGCYIAKMRTFGFTQSVRRYAELLPQDWEFTFEDRSIRIDIPCPPPVTVASRASTPQIDVIDPLTLETLVTGDPLPGAADAIAVFADIAIVATAESGEVVAVPGQLHRVNLETGAVEQSMQFPGLHTAIAADPLFERLFMATADGVLRTLDPYTFAETGRVEGLPPGPWAEIIASHDGGVVYARPGQQGQTLPALAGADLPGPPGGAVGVFAVSLLHGTVTMVPGTEALAAVGIGPVAAAGLAVLTATPNPEVVVLQPNAPVVRAPVPAGPRVLITTSDGRTFVATENGIEEVRPDDPENPIRVDDGPGNSLGAFPDAEGRPNVIGTRPDGTGFRRRFDGAQYENPLGGPSPPIIDTRAFRTGP